MRRSERIPTSFDTWFSAEAPAELSSEDLTRLLQAWEIVQSARPDAPAIDPVVNAADDPRSPNQGYLDPAPEGEQSRRARTWIGVTAPGPSPGPGP